MKKQFKLFAASVLLGTGICSAMLLGGIKPVYAEDSSTVIENNENGIPDEKLYKVLLEKCDKNSDGKLAVDEVKDITVLHLRNEEIADLTGLDKLESLRSLIVVNVQTLNSLDGVSNLAHLENIDICYGNISDISGLANLPELKKIQLEHNNISDVSSLANLTSLEIVKLSGNNISDISGLENLKKLITLLLDNNKIEDLSPVGNSPELSHLSAIGNQLQTLSGLKNMPNLWQLWVSDNRISSLEGLKEAELPKLARLEASGNEIKAVDGIEGLEKLWMVNLDDNNIENLEALRTGFTKKLVSLKLNNNNITDITPLSGLASSLEYLELSNNNITDISGLKSLHLGYLELAGNKVEDLSVFKEDLCVVSLGLSDNNISDISPLAGNSFEKLYLDGNKISDISPLASIATDYIKWLDLSNNQISDISALSEITATDKLKCLNLTNNQIEDITPIKSYLELVGRGIENRAIYCAEAYSKDNLEEDSIYGYILLRGNPITEEMYRKAAPESLLNSKVCINIDGKDVKMGRTWLEAQLRTEKSLYDEGWNELDGQDYWYIDGVRQGYRPEDESYRGEEIYDPESDAWYWLDNVQGGATAKNKDVYLTSSGGKWVHYDENGHMVKGENYRNFNWYRSDEVTGEMIKGWYRTDDGRVYYYDEETGIMKHGFNVIDGRECMFDNVTGVALNNQWYIINGLNGWYENGVRQGYNLEDESYRGKEIYDPAADAWFWLDAVQKGAKAVSKDVYQESYAGAFAENEDGTGKWVRYDEDGRMVKGWDTNENGTYYFDKETGAMAKGNVTIDGKEYYFDSITGIML